MDRVLHPARAEGLVNTGYVYSKKKGKYLFSFLMQNMQIN